MDKLLAGPAARPVQVTAVGWDALARLAAHLSRVNGQQVTLGHAAELAAQRMLAFIDSSPDWPGRI